MRKSADKYHPSFKDPLYYTTPLGPKKEQIETATLQTLKRMEAIMGRFEQIFLNMAGTNAPNQQQPFANESMVTVRSQQQQFFKPLRQGNDDVDNPSMKRSVHHLKAEQQLLQDSKMSQGKTRQPTTHSTNAHPSIAAKQYGDFRDQECVVPFAMNTGVQYSSKQVANAISKWISKIMDILTKETFSGYSNDVADSDCRIFMCNNIVLGFHSVSEFLIDHYPQLWNRHSQDFIRHLQLKITETLEYYMSKYPSHAKVLVPREVESLLTSVDKSNIPIFNLLRRLRLSLNPFRYFPNDYVQGYATNYNYRKDIRNLINACIQECKSKYDEFQYLMEEIFTINVKTGKHFERKPIPGNKVGMKFRRNMPIIPSNDSNDSTIEISSSQVLRVLIKWIEQLDDFLEHPEVHIRERSDLEPFVVDPMYRDGEVVFLTEQAKWKLTEEVIALRQRLRAQGQWHFYGLNSVFHNLTAYVRVHRDQFDFLPDNTIKTGMSVHLLDGMTTETAVVYLNRMLGLLYDSKCKAFPKGNGLLDDESARLLELVPFTTKDLLRAQCYGDIEEMRQIIHNISNDERVTIVRVKNRLNTPNHDFLINFTFKGCQLICELQVGLDLKEKVQYKSEQRKGFSHFLYELSRSKFGPLVEAALIVNNVSETGKYFRKKTTPCKNVQELNFKAEIGSDFQLIVPHFSKLGSSANFVCSRCLQPRYAHRSFQPGWCRAGHQQYLCAICIYDSLSSNYKPVYAMGGKQGSFFRVSHIQDLDRQPHQCVVTVDPFRYGQGSCTYYSSITQKPSEQPSLEINSAVKSDQRYEDRIAKEHLKQRESHKYFGCFQVDSKVFYQKSHFSGKLIFQLIPLTGSQRIELLLISEKCESELDVLLHLIGKIEDVGSTIKTQYPMFLWSAAIPVNRSYSQIAVCLVDPPKNTLLVFDFEDKNCEAKKLSFFRKTGDGQDRKPQSRVNYEKNGYDEEMFRFLQKGKDVEELNLNQNNFKTTDFLDIPNLKNLSLRLNRIESLEVSAGKLQELRCLDLCGNNINIINFDEVHLPRLQTLLLNFNYIESINFGSSPAQHLPELQRFEMSDNLLKSFNLEASIPNMRFLILNNNKAMESLIVSNQQALVSLQANCCSLTSFWIEGKFDSLNKLQLKANNLRQVAVQQAVFPALKELFLSYNRINSFNMCAPCPELHTLDLSFNNLNCISFADIPAGQEPKALEDLIVYSTEQTLEMLLGAVSFAEDNCIQLDFEMNCSILYGSEHQRKQAHIYMRDLSHDNIGKIWLMSYQSHYHELLKEELSQPKNKQHSDIKLVMLEDAFHSYVRVGSDGLDALSTFPNFDVVSSAVDLHQRLRKRSTSHQLMGTCTRLDTSQEVKEDLLSESEEGCDSHLFKCGNGHQLSLVQSFGPRNRCGSCNALLQGSMLRQCGLCSYHACVACPKRFQK